jgi:hypothetical protein
MSDQKQIHSPSTIQVPLTDPSARKLADGYDCDLISASQTLILDSCRCKLSSNCYVLTPNASSDCFCMGYIFAFRAAAGIQFLQHFPYMHPSKKSEDLAEMMRFVGELTAPMYDACARSWQAGVLEHIGVGAYDYIPQRLQLRMLKIATEGCKRIFDEQELPAFFHSMLELAVAKEGDRIRFMSLFLVETEPSEV